MVGYPIILAFLVVASTAQFKLEKGVLVLTDANFQEALRQHPDLFVDFYAPWCEHCKKLAPVLEQLASKDLRAKVAKIDSTENEQTAIKYDISSYPTLLYFTQDFTIEYRGYRIPEVMEAWLLHKYSPFKTVSTNQQLEQLSKNSNVKIFFYGDNQDVLYEPWRKASFYQDQQQFVLAPAQLVTHLPKGTLVMSSHFLHEPLVYSGEATLDQVRQWVEDNINPPVRPFFEKTIKLIFEQLHPALLLIDRLNDSQQALSALSHFCAFKDHEFICTHVTPEDDIYSKMVEWINIDISGSFLVLLDTQNRKLYLYDSPIQGINNDLLMDWVKAYEEGNLQPVSRPQDEQQAQGQDQGGEQVEEGNGGEHSTQLNTDEEL